MLDSLLWKWLKGPRGVFYTSWFTPPCQWLCSILAPMYLLRFLSKIQKVFDLKPVGIQCNFQSSLSTFVRFWLASNISFISAVTGSADFSFNLADGSVWQLSSSDHAEPSAILACPILLSWCNWQNRLLSTHHHLLALSRHFFFLSFLRFSQSFPNFHAEPPHLSLQKKQGRSP